MAAGGLGGGERSWGPAGHRAPPALKASPSATSYGHLPHQPRPLCSRSGGAPGMARPLAQGPGASQGHSGAMEGWPEQARAGPPPSPPGLSQLPSARSPFYVGLPWRLLAWSCLRPGRGRGDQRGAGSCLGHTVVWPVQLGSQETACSSLRGTSLPRRLRPPAPHPILHKGVLSTCLTKRIEGQRPEHGHELRRGPQSPADARGRDLRQVHLQDPPRAVVRMRA